MKITPFWALMALLDAPAVLANAIGTSSSATPTTTAASCTASLITSLCSYPKPGGAFAVASDGKASCWRYCNAHTPCNFVIFVAGNPYTGTGTCWLYPGQDFDVSKGDSNCGNPSLSVYNKPVCADSTTPGACTATASPSAVASVCGYPEPSDCFSTCLASSGASHCLSLCAKADACSYVVFNPHNSDNSPYAPGTCWVYTSGTYNAKSATACSGAPEQFVYNNVCPKPSSPKPSLSSSSTARSTGNAAGNEAGNEAGTTAGTAVATADAIASLASSSTARSTGNAAGNATADAIAATTSSSKSSAPTGFSPRHPLAIGVAALVWQNL